MPFMSATLDTSHFEMSPEKACAPINIPDMSFTRDTSHFEMAPSNAFASLNMALMSVTLDTSHSPIGPCGQSEQSPFGDSLRYASIAPLSSSLDCGENAEVVALLSSLLDCGQNAEVVTLLSLLDCGEIAGV